MREARIILPSFDNNGASLEALHKDLKRDLCRRFGGYTATATMGGWVSDTGDLYEEPGVAYDVAIEATQDHTLRDLALIYGVRAKQLAMYVRYSTGKVEIVDTSVPATVAA